MNNNRGVASKKFNDSNQSMDFLPLKLFLILAFFLIILPLTSAIEVTMDQNFDQGETMLAVFSGNFVDQITKDNVYFYRGHVEIPVTFDVIKISDDFYLYAVLTDKTPGNYSVSVKEVRYYKSTQIVDDEIVSNFTISNNTAAFSANPGVVSTDSSFTVELQNLKDNSITVDIITPDSINSPSSVSMNTGTSKIVSFSIDSTASSGLNEITFSSSGTTYSMPVYLDTENTPANETNNTPVSEDFDMEFQPKVVNVSMAIDSDTKRILYIKNTGSTDLEDLSITIPQSLSEYVSVSPTEISSLEAGETKQITIDITSDSEEKTISGNLIARTEDASTSFSLVLNFLADFVPEDSDSPIIATSCEDLGGTVCSVSLECSGDIVQSKNGDCCVLPLTCQEPKRGISKTLIGWGLLILVFLIVYWFYRRRYSRIAYRPRF